MIVNSFGVKMSRSEFENIVKSFPGRDEGQKKRINIARFYDYKYTVLNNKIYDKVDMFNGDGDFSSRHEK